MQAFLSYGFVKIQRVRKTNSVGNQGHAALVPLLEAWPETQTTHPTEHNSRKGFTEVEISRSEEN